MVAGALQPRRARRVGGRDLGVTRGGAGCARGELESVSISDASVGHRPGGFLGGLERGVRALKPKLVRARMQGRRFERLVAVTPCPHLMHLGSDYGGYVIPADLPDSSWVAYCGGVGEDGSFELELARRYGCRVVAFDPTPRSIRYAESELVEIGRASCRERV